MKNYIKPIVFGTLLSLASSVVLASQANNRDEDDEAVRTGSWVPSTVRETAHTIAAKAPQAWEDVKTGTTKFGNDMAKSLGKAGDRIATGARNISASLAESGHNFSAAITEPSEAKSEEARNRLNPVTGEVAAWGRDLSSHYRAPAPDTEENGSPAPADAHKPASDQELRNVQTAGLESLRDGARDSSSATRDAAANSAGDPH